MSKLSTLRQRYESEAQGLRDRNAALASEMSENNGKIALIEAKIEGITEAQEAMGVGSPAPRRSTAAKGSSRRKRGLSPQWQEILREANIRSTFSYDDLSEIADKVGHDIPRDNLRSQMSLYKQSGLIRSVGLGIFRLTPEGMQAAGVSAGHGNPLAENGALNSYSASAPETGGVAAPSSSTSADDLL